MYIKILIYIIDNQQFKWKISIPFWLASRLPFLFPALRGLGGAVQKNGRPHGPISGRWSVPHIPHIPAIPHTSTCDAHPNISLISPSNPFIVPSRPSH